MVIRDNWRMNMTEAQHKRRLFTTILHELAHVAGYDEDSADELESCGKRNLTREEAIDNTGTISVYQTNIQSFECKYISRLVCREFTMHEPPHWEGDDEEQDSDDNESGSPWCGVTTFQYRAMTFSYYLCVGEPIPICWMELDPKQA